MENEAGTEEIEDDIVKIEEEEDQPPSPIKDFKAVISKKNASKIAKGIQYRSVEIRKVSVRSKSMKSDH